MSGIVHYETDKTDENGDIEIKATAFIYIERTREMYGKFRIIRPNGDEVTIHKDQLVKIV